MTYDPGIWDSHPERVYVKGHRVKAGWFRTDDPHQVTVALANGTRLILLVVPLDLEADQASWALERSIEPDNVLGPAALLELARLGGGDDELQRWFGEGGLAAQPRSAGTSPAGESPHSSEEQP